MPVTPDPDIARARDARRPASRQPDPNIAAMRQGSWRRGDQPARTPLASAFPGERTTTQASWRNPLASALPVGEIRATNLTGSGLRATGDTLFTPPGPSWTPRAKARLPREHGMVHNT